MGSRIGTKREQALMNKAKGDTEIGGGALSVDTAGTVEVKTAGTPEFNLEKTNPGAKWGKRIWETTIDFAGTGTLNETGGPIHQGAISQNNSVCFTSSLEIPQYTIINAVGVYVNEAFSGSTPGADPACRNFIDRIGLSASIAGTAAGNDWNQDLYFFTSSLKEDGTRMILSASGDSAVLFAPPNGILSQSAQPGEDVADAGALQYTKTFYTAITGSSTVVSVTLASASNSTGSVRLALFGETFWAPTS